MSKQRLAKRIGALSMMTALVALFSVASGGCDLLKSKSEKKAFAEACTQAVDCESGECATYGSICTKGCTYDKDCGSGLVCRAKDTGTGSECSKPYGIAPGPAATCNQPSECQHAQCLKKSGEATGSGICSKYCQDASECPDGMKICESISDSGALKFCLPGDPAAPPAEKPKFVVPKPKPITDGGLPEAGTVSDAGGTATPDAGGGTATPDAGGGAATPDAGATGTPDAGATGTPDAGGATGTPDAGATGTPDAGIRVIPKFNIPKKP